MLTHQRFGRHEARDTFSVRHHKQIKSRYKTTKELQTDGGDLKTDGKQSSTGKNSNRKSTRAGFNLIFWVNTSTVDSHETQQNHHGYEVMFQKRELPGTSFAAASEVKCPLRKSPWLEEQRYKFLKDEQGLPCSTSEQTGLVLL